MLLKKKKIKSVLNLLDNNILWEIILSQICHKQSFPMEHHHLQQQQKKSQQKTQPPRNFHQKPSQFIINIWRLHVKNIFPS